MFILPYCNVVSWVLDLCLMCWCAAWFRVKAIPLIISSFVQGNVPSLQTRTDRSWNKFQLYPLQMALRLG